MRKALRRGSGEGYSRKMKGELWAAPVCLGLALAALGPIGEDFLKRDHNVEQHNPRERECDEHA